MMWYKQPTDFLETPTAVRIIDELGMQGFGILCAVIQIIAKNMHPGSEPEVIYSVKNWARVCRCTPITMKKFIQIILELDGFSVDFSESKKTKNRKNLEKKSRKFRENSEKISGKFKKKYENQIIENDSFVTIKYVKLLNQKDDWCRKSDRKNLSSPDLVRTKSGIDKDKDIDIPPIVPPLGDCIFSSCALEVLDHLNQKTGASYRPVPENLRVIDDRIKTGLSAEELKKVIDIKFDEWHNTRDFAKHLCPKTLFKPANFEQYYGQMRKKVDSVAKSKAQTLANSAREQAMHRQSLLAYRAHRKSLGSSQEEIDRLYPIN